MEGQEKTDKRQTRDGVRERAFGQEGCRDKKIEEGWGNRRTREDTNDKAKGRKVERRGETRREEKERG